MRQEVLDHGYVELVESWGSDERIIEAARMSTAKGFLGWGTPAFWRDDTTELGNKPTLHPAVEGDEKLLRYLWTHGHHTPFEMAGLTLEVQAPIFVFREWHRHRTQSYNELSARYTPLPDVCYVPTVERCLLPQGNNKQAQARSTEYVLDEQQVELWLGSLQELYDRAESVYKTGLDWGIPKELARCAVTVSRYSRMRASGNLRNWLHFLDLRLADNAQWEIRQFAQAVAVEVEWLFPRTYELFNQR